MNIPDCKETEGDGSNADLLDSMAAYFPSHEAMSNASPTTSYQNFPEVAVKEEGKQDINASQRWESLGNCSNIDMSDSAAAYASSRVSMFNASPEKGCLKFPEGLMEEKGSVSNAGVSDSAMAYSPSSLAKLKGSPMSSGFESPEAPIGEGDEDKHDADEGELSEGKAEAVPCLDSENEAGCAAEGDSDDDAEEEADACSSHSEYVPSSDDDDQISCVSEPTCSKLLTGESGSLKRRRTSELGNKRPKICVDRITDDASDQAYYRRIKAWKQRELEKARHQVELRQPALLSEDSMQYVEICESYRIPADLWNRLYNYQQSGVRWLCELNRNANGGILGDEMGVGKTAQVIAFLAALACSDNAVTGFRCRGLGPVLLVCPTTVMHQWVRQFHDWWPMARVALLHQSGSYQGSSAKLVKKMCERRGVLITSYSSLIFKAKQLLSCDWHYVILDEGHKIRNPAAKQSLCAKRLRTPYRLILSGTPVQNSLKELWSLFDFVRPGLLGTQQVFLNEFGVPITQGGYANANPVQIQVAYKCACLVRHMIRPFLMRRTKEDVMAALRLPSKNEQVLFCHLTEEQKALYRSYLQSNDVESIFQGICQVFVGLTMLRKICNHPDLADGMVGDRGGEPNNVPAAKVGDWRRSGKMVVVRTLLKLWHKQGHRVLLFSQSRKMLTIFEKMISRKHYSYLRIDGTTPIKLRQAMIDTFNSNETIFVLLLTTRVGGLGVNLTGADRVLIYDPDWNPSTDAQARERAWRIGQTRPVTVYRLLTVGTIEEKIYHRQIFKHFLTNRVLKDPRQRRFFKTNELRELFTFSDDSIESDMIFAGTGSTVKVPKPKPESTESHLNLKLNEDAGIQPSLNDSLAVSISPARLEELHLLARKMSRTMSATSSNKAEGGGIESLSTKAKKPPCGTFEGIKVPFLKNRVFKSVQDEKGLEHESKKQDEYVLSKLFHKSSVCRALKHDKIIKSSTLDSALIEAEADRIATKASKALARSRRDVFLPFSPELYRRRPRFGIHVASGGFSSQTAGETEVVDAVEEEKLFTTGASDDDPLAPRSMSSVELLTAIQRRKCLYPSVSATASDNELSSDSPSAQFSCGGGCRQILTRYDVLLGELRTFIATDSRVNGEATTKEIMDHFRSRVSVQDSAVFKAMLKKVCAFERRNGEGVWILKEEYR